VTLDGGMQYTQTVEHAFHVSMAAVEPEMDKGLCHMHNNLAAMSSWHLLLCIMKRSEIKRGGL